MRDTLDAAGRTAAVTSGDPYLTGRRHVMEEVGGRGGFMTRETNRSIDLGARGGDRAISGG